MHTTTKTITLGSGRRVMRGTPVEIVNVYDDGNFVVAERVKDRVRFVTYATDITNDNTNVCADIHEPEVVTLTMTIDQLYRMRTIMDIAREDECDDDDAERTATAELADAMHREISEAIKHYEGHDA